jgi:hypothetical protein
MKLVIYTWYLVYGVTMEVSSTVLKVDEMMVIELKTLGSGGAFFHI